LFAVPLRLNVKGLIWYPVEAFAGAGYEIPNTWDELLALSDRIVADGGAPWCWGDGDSSATGWPATDWIEDILLRESGVAAYDRWVSGDLPFQSPEVRTAFERLGEIAFAPGYVRGGIEIGLLTPHWVAMEPMFDDPPGCWLYHQASFATQWIPHSMEWGRDIRAMPFPDISGLAPDALIGGGDFLMAFRDRPEVRELIRFATRPDFGTAWATFSVGFLSANTSFDPANYVSCDAAHCAIDPEVQNLGHRVVAALTADAFRFDGSDLLDESGGDWMWRGMIDYLSGGPDSLDEVLAHLDDQSWRDSVVPGLP
jgi:alpha-glucoside transport system substrate-binding protein